MTKWVLHEILEGDGDAGEVNGLETRDCLLTGECWHSTEENSKLCREASRETQRERVTRGLDTSGGGGSELQEPQGKECGWGEVFRGGKRGSSAKQGCSQCVYRHRHICVLRVTSLSGIQWIWFFERNLRRPPLLPSLLLEGFRLTETEKRQKTQRWALHLSSIRSLWRFTLHTGTKSRITKKRNESPKGVAYFEISMSQKVNKP